jgi:hypothetical protein
MQFSGESSQGFKTPHGTKNGKKIRLEELDVKS